MRDLLTRISPQNIWRFLAAKFRNFYSLILWGIQSRPASTPVLLPKTLFLGSTANFFRVRPGVVLKSPTTIGFDQTPQVDPSVEKHFHAEKRILEHLGRSPQIVEYLGWKSSSPTGLLFKEANNGSLQSFLDDQNNDITVSQRQKWCQQAVKCVAYIHSRGVIHSDLRPDNFLVHSSDLVLCDFGASTCDAIGITSNGLPGCGFFNPLLPWEASTKMDVFSLGSVLYIIITGYWPYRSSRERMYTDEELDEYELLVDDKFREGHFPHVNDARWDGVIQKCWNGALCSGQEVAEFIMPS